MYPPGLFSYQWARRAIGAYQVWQADYILAETNTAGLMVEHTLHTINPRVPLRTVRATHRKLTISPRPFYR